MANDCLVTKLKGVVQNDNLDKLNIITFTVYAGCNFRITPTANITINSTVGMKCYYGTSNDGQTVTSTTVQHEAEASIDLSAGSEVSIESKYSIYNFAARWDPALNINISKLAYSALHYLYAPGSGVTGELSAFKTTPNLTEAFLGSTNISGNLQNLSNCVGLEKIEIDQTNIGGSITDLGNLINLISINLYRTAVTGSIEELAAAQVSAGRTSGTLDVTYGAPITYNGEPPVDSGRTIITFDSSLPNGYSIVSI